MTCANGHAVPAGARFCPTCGTGVAAALPPPPTYGPAANAWPASGPYAAPAPWGATYVPSYLAPMNGFAIASMVLGILWLYWTGSLLALIFGLVARHQILARGERGMGFAVAGIVLGSIGIALGVMFVVLVAVLAAHNRALGPAVH